MLRQDFYTLISKFQLTPHLQWHIPKTFLHMDSMALLLGCDELHYFSPIEAAEYQNISKCFKETGKRENQCATIKMLATERALWEKVSSSPYESFSFSCQHNFHVLAIHSFYQLNSSNIPAIQPVAAQVHSPAFPGNIIPSGSVIGNW